MALSPSESTSLFTVPITKYRNIGIMQRELLKRAVTTPNDTLAATRLLSFVYDTDLSSLFEFSLEDVRLGTLTESELLEITSAQELFSQMEPFETIIRSAVNEGKKFLPPPTSDIIQDYNTDGSPLERVAVAVFLIMATNLQV